MLLRAQVLFYVKVVLARGPEVGGVVCVLAIG